MYLLRLRFRLTKERGPDPILRKLSFGPYLLSFEVQQRCVATKVVFSMKRTMTITPGSWLEMLALIYESFLLWQATAAGPIVLVCTSFFINISFNSHGTRTFLLCCLFKNTAKIAQISPRFRQVIKFLNEHGDEKEKCNRNEVYGRNTSLNNF